MGNAEPPEPRPAGIPRWLALALAPVVWLVALPVVHAGIPWALSHLGPRYGWADGGPSGWNLLGCVPVAVGAALLVWIMVFGLSRYRYRDLPERVPIDWSPAPLLCTTSFDVRCGGNPTWRSHHDYSSRPGGRSGSH